MADPRPLFPPSVPIDLSTGLPATRPPAGSNVIDPYRIILPPSDFKRPDTSKAGTRNEGIYPESKSGFGGGGGAIPADYGNRPDGTPKGRGFLGELKRPDGGVSTELSVGINLNGKETLIPLLVPTLDKAQVDHLLSGKKWTQDILDKAVTFATERMRTGRSPFADSGDGPANMDPAFMGRMRDQMRGGSGMQPRINGTSEADIPMRHMLQNRDPDGSLPNTGIPNAYRGKLQPEGALPDQSPAAYPDWKTRI